VLGNDASDPSAVEALAHETAAVGGLDGPWLNAGYGAVAAVDDWFSRWLHGQDRQPA
jgi:NAD(P)-dependent dehydrogenase (short-subunit alcohol dehydrogenase family)